jgi:hypothetical protein
VGSLDNIMERKNEHSTLNNKLISIILYTAARATPPRKGDIPTIHWTSYPPVRDKGGAPTRL